MKRFNTFIIIASLTIIILGIISGKRPFVTVTAAINMLLWLVGGMWLLKPYFENRTECLAAGFVLSTSFCSLVFSAQNYPGAGAFAVFSFLLLSSSLIYLQYHKKKTKSEKYNWYLTVIFIQWLYVGPYYALATNI